ncbi:MAG: hypothetical protein ACO1RX_07535 [Candidatus Sericytochromatia bacterium]
MSPHPFSSLSISSLCLLGLLSLGAPAWAQTSADPAAEPSETETWTLPETEEGPAEDTPAEEPPAEEPLPDSAPADGGDFQLQNPFNAPFSQQNFVPDISLILDVSAGGRSLGNEDYAALRNPFDLRNRNSLHHVSNANNGFNLNYAELTISSPADPYLDLLATFHLSGFEIEIEEAYFNSRGLPWNLQFKGGKFLSHFGRLNAQHAHFWSFEEQPLVYRSFFGAENINELGARLSWLAPVDFYLDLGLEVLQGSNSSSFGTEGFAVGDTRQAGVNLPNLLVGTVKTSLDLTDELVLLGALSYAQGGTRFAAASETTGHTHVHQVREPLPGLDNVAGATQVFGGDLSLRYLFDSYTDLTWQSEVLVRRLSGSRYDGSGRHSLDLTQSGLYSQLLWRFAQQWRSGLRLDLLGHEQRSTDGQTSDGPGWLPRYSAMLEYHPSEFSRLRLQYNLDNSRWLNSQQTPVHEVFLSLNLAIGAHGAHEF